MSAGWRFIGAVIAGAMLAGCGGPEPKPAKPEMVVGLRLQKIELQTVAAELEAPGTVIAVATAQIAARTMGTVLQVAVREGDTVQRGQLLAQLDERELMAHRNAAVAGSQSAEAGIAQAQKGVAAAQASADVMQKTYERYAYLKEQKSISPQEFDEISAKQQAAQAQLEQAKAALKQAQAGREQAQAEVHAAESVASYARIVAPFDGRVVRRAVEPGSLVSPGMPLFVVEDSSRYQLQATLPTEALAIVKRGSATRVELDAMEARPLEGKVAEIEGGADPGSHTVAARIDLPRGAALQSGVFGRALFARGERKALIVPEEAAIARGQLRGVYAVDGDGVLHWRVVTLGGAQAGRVEVLSGVSGGDVLVLNPGVQELDGKKTAQTAAAGEKHS